MRFDVCPCSSHNRIAGFLLENASVLPGEEGKGLTVALNVKNGISDFTTEFVNMVNGDKNVRLCDAGKEIPGATITPGGCIPEDSEATLESIRYVEGEALYHMDYVANVDWEGLLRPDPIRQETGKPQCGFMGLHYLALLLKPIMKRLIYCLLVFLCISCQKSGNQSADSTLYVAMYPYMQRADEAKRIIGEIWDRQDTGWRLEFKDWNCYSEGPRTDIDVFCIDCLFEQYYRKEGMISAISKTDIIDQDDFYDCFNLSDECNGIPFLLCQDFLIYPERDRQIADAVNARELLDCAKAGNVWTLTAGNMNGIYLRTCAEIYGYECEGMFHTTDIDQCVLENLKPYLELGGKKARATHNEETARAFVAGEGRAYVGFSEVLSLLQEYPEPLSIINFAITGNRRSNYYYADKICVNKSVTNEERRKAALLLANLLCSREFLERYISNDGKCLFYIPARPSVSCTLEQWQPVYHSIDSLASANDAFILYGDSAFWEYNERILSKMTEVLDDSMRFYRK